MNYMMKLLTGAGRRSEDDLGVGLIIEPDELQPDPQPKTKPQYLLLTGASIQHMIDVEQTDLDNMRKRMATIENEITRLQEERRQTDVVIRSTEFKLDILQRNLRPPEPEGDAAAEASADAVQAELARRA